MAQKQSWNGSITSWYEKNLGLRGGYARKLNMALPSSVMNSEYVKSDSSGLSIHAKSGRKVNPFTRRNLTPHFKNPYGNDMSARNQFNKKIKKKFQMRLRGLR